jgi:putative aminopeptidase FrvX
VLKSSAQNVVVILSLWKGDGVLFSAHFDSVSTAPGATDDGMSVVALVQLVNFLSKNRPRRTAVFNINNGEEDGLHGAHACVVFITLVFSSHRSHYPGFCGIRGPI